jgi:hypothetical protein
MPPDSSIGYLFSNSLKPTMARSSRARLRAAAIGRPCTSAGSSTFSITVRQGSRIGFWNTMPMSVRGAATTVPPTAILPALAGSRPAISLSSVLLPQPLGPTMVTNSRSPTASDMS